MCRRNGSLGSVERFLDFVPGCMKLFSAGGLAREAYLAILLLRGIPISAMSLAIMIRGPSRPWSDRYLFSTLNAFHGL
jgi:hypothetical protein